MFLILVDIFYIILREKKNVIVTGILGNTGHLVSQASYYRLAADQIAASADENVKEPIAKQGA